MLHLIGIDRKLIRSPINLTKKNKKQLSTTPRLRANCSQRINDEQL